MNTLKTKLLRILLAVIFTVSLVPCADLLGELTQEQRNRLNQIKQQFPALGDLIDKTLNPRARAFADVGAKLASMEPEQIKTFAESDQNLYQSARQAMNYLEALSTQTPARTNVAQNSNNLPQLQQLDPLLNENNSNESTDNGAPAQGSENHSSFQNQENGEQQQIENQQQLQQQPEKEKEEEALGQNNSNDSDNSPQRHIADQQQQQLQQRSENIVVNSDSDGENSDRSQQPQIPNKENGPDINSPDQSEDISAGPEEEEEEEEAPSGDSSEQEQQESANDLRQQVQDIAAQPQVQNQENGPDISSPDQSEGTSVGPEEEEEEEYPDSDGNVASHHEEEEEEEAPSENGGEQEQQEPANDLQRQVRNADGQRDQPRQTSTFQAPPSVQQQLQQVQQQLQQQLQQQRTLSAAMNNAAGNGPLPEYRNDIFEQASVLRQNANVLQDVARHVSATDNRRVVLNAGYLNHKQSVARGLGYNADTFMITGVVNGFVVDTPNGGTCSLALAAAYADTSAKYKGKCSKSGNKFKEKTFLVGPCITYKLGMFEVDASLLYGHTKYDALRSFDFAGVRMDARNSSYKGDSLHGQLVVSYAIPYSSFIVQPQVGITYDHITQKGHKFRNGNAALDVKKQKLDFLTVFTGVRVSTDTLISGRLKPYIFVGFAQDVHRHADVAKKVKASYGANSPQTNAVSYPGKRGHLMTSAGVEFMATDAISVDVSYHGNFNGHRKTHAALCGVGYNF